MYVQRCLPHFPAAGEVVRQRPGRYQEPDLPLRHIPTPF
jgi:hypothetical protein